MALQEKYRPVLDEIYRFGSNINVTEENGVLQINGAVPTHQDKVNIWNKIKQVGGGEPGDIAANITVQHNDIWARHKVESGETLSEISKRYYGDPNRYMDIFNANKDKLNDPNKIQPGQELIVPHMASPASRT